MTTITVDAPRTRQGRRDRMRTAWSSARRQATTTVSAARHRNWSPALTVSGFICIDTSAFQLAAGHISPGIGLLVTGLSAWGFDWSRD